MRLTPLLPALLLSLATGIAHETGGKLFGGLGLRVGF
jgi:hypothetical protein